MSIVRPVRAVTPTVHGGLNITVIAQFTAYLLLRRLQLFYLLCHMLFLLF